MPAAPKAGFEGIPADLIPLRFRISNAKNSSVVIALVVLYVLIGGVLLLGYSYAGQKITLATGLQILGIGGDGISAAILIFTMSVNQYSLQMYKASFMTKAQHDYPNRPQQDLDEMLANFHGILQSTTGNILKNQLGATLLAISTVLGFIGAVLKG